jgi:hypothetical protein
MKALTLTQPWASLVAVGAKRIETRSWGTTYRGPLAIHAAKGMNKEALRVVTEEPFWTALQPAYGHGWLPRGCVIAIVQLVDVIPAERALIAHADSREQAFGDYSEGRYAWIFGHVVPVDPPSAAKGMLGLWDWTEE